MLFFDSRNIINGQRHLFHGFREKIKVQCRVLMASIENFWIMKLELRYNIWLHLTFIFWLIKYMEKGSQIV